MIRMINMKAAIVAVLFLSNMVLTHAVLRGNRTPVDPTKELRTAMNRIRALKVGADDNAKAAKQNKAEREPPTDNPGTPETSAPTVLPTGSPTAGPTGPPTASPTHEPTGPPTGPPAEMPSMSPTTQPASDPDSFDAIIEVACKPDGDTALTFAESSSKTIICDATNPSCREAVTAVKESAELQNFFGCAGDLGEGAARKLFNKYATDAVLAEQLTMIAATNAILVTERPDAMNAACADIAMMQSPAVADPCCQGSSGCTSAAASTSSSPPFMTVAITGCTGDSACKNIGPNPLILDSSCTGESACESMNENDLNPSVVGVTFVGEASCTNPGSCEGVGHRSYGNVVVLDASCVGSDACNAAGRRSQQKTSNRFPSHINIGPNACVGIDACKDTHSTVNYGTAGKYKGGLTIGDGGCDQDRSCEKIGFNDRLGMDIIVAPGECSVAGTCRGCITAKDCDNGGAYLISNTDGACPKGDSSSGGNPTGERVEEYCIGRDSLPTETPTFFPTPLPTITRRPTNSPTVFGSAMPSTVPSEAPSDIPSEAPSDVPSSLPSGIPSAMPSGLPSQQPSDAPSDVPSENPSGTPSGIPSYQPSSVPSSLPSRQPTGLPSEIPSQMPSATASDSPSEVPSSTPSEVPSWAPSDSMGPSDVPSTTPSIAPSESQAPSEAPTTPPPSMGVGCLNTPGDGSSTFNGIVGDVSCDGGTGPCANFLTAIAGLTDDKANMIKSIFGCGKIAGSTVSLEVAQKRFNKIKNDAEVTQLLLTTVETKKLFTAGSNQLTAPCNGRCCTGSNACTTRQSGDNVLTVSEGSCMSLFSCSSIHGDSIVLESCTAKNACSNYGIFDTVPNTDVAVGHRVIGPGACTGETSCTFAGRNVMGNVRVHKGACTGTDACRSLGGRKNQGTNASPIVVNIILEENACQGAYTCGYAYRTTTHATGSFIVKKGACKGGPNIACYDISNGDAENTLVIAEGACSDGSDSCKDCVKGGKLCELSTQTYTIDDPATECPGPVQSACS